MAGYVVLLLALQVCIIDLCRRLGLSLDASRGVGLTLLLLMSFPLLSKWHGRYGKHPSFTIWVLLVVIAVALSLLFQPLLGS